MQSDTSQMQHRKLGTYLSAILGIAGNAPAYSIAVTTSTLVAASGWLSPWVMAFCGLLMFGIAGSYRRLNAHRVSGGAAFTWVSDLVNPVVGFLSGWSLLVASILFLVSASLPAAQTLLSFTGSSVIESKLVVAGVAAVIIVGMAFLAKAGVFSIGRVQAVLTIIELLVLLMILIGCLLAASDAAVTSIVQSGKNITTYSVDAFAKGIVVAVFFYWGWDVVFNASEETKHSEVRSGRAAYIAMLSLVILFTAYSAFAVEIVSEKSLEDAQGNMLLALSRRVLPSGVAEVALLAFLLSTIGAISASFVQFSQTLFAQSRAGYFRRFFARSGDSTSSPWSAIAFDAVVAFIILLAATLSTTIDGAVQATIAASSVLVAFYYGATALACAAFEKRLHRGISVRHSGAPIVAACVLIGAAVYSAFAFSMLTLVMVAATYVVGLAIAFSGRQQAQGIL